MFYFSRVCLLRQVYELKTTSWQSCTTDNLVRLFVRRSRMHRESKFKQIHLIGTLIPSDDFKSLNEFHEVMDLCKSLPKNSTNFGLIHADHAPQNFRYDVNQNRITSFDFGNCCYHWYAADVAISLSTIRRKEKREEIRENLLAGYSSIRNLPADSDKLIDLFIRLRVIYVYLSRLYFWSKNRTSEQQAQLEPSVQKCKKPASLQVQCLARGSFPLRLSSETSKENKFSKN